MNGDHGLTWRAIGTECNSIAKGSVMAFLSMVRHSWVLLVVVLLTGWLSYETLRGLAEAMKYGDVAAAVFPLQLDIAAIPAYQVAADRTRAPLQRWSCGVMAGAILGGSVYGNLAAHFGWLDTWQTKLFVSVVSPTVCALTLVIWHLPRLERAARVVAAKVSTSSRYAEAEHPTETSTPEPETTQTEQTEPEVEPQPLHSVPSPTAEVRIPEGPWTESDCAPFGLRRFVAQFWDLNDRAPDSSEVYGALPAKAREQRLVPAAIRAVREKREREASA